MIRQVLSLGAGYGWFLFALLLFALPGFVPEAAAINITIDYRYDNGATPFFNTQTKKNALQAAADRWSAIITQSLSAVTLSNDSGLFARDARISITHPTTGVQNYQISAATSPADDAVFAAGAAAANEYRGPWSIAADQWILYAGGRPLSVAGVGGTGTGTNLIYSGPNNDAFDDRHSHLNRNFRLTGSSGRLPVWGGWISFDNDDSTDWHFGINTAAPAGTVDFYSIALHEIGHALGLSGGWDDWRDDNAGSYIGPEAINAYNADNNASVGTLNLTADGHWQNNTYDSRIFANGNPNYAGTVGPGSLQDLLMEPLANFTSTLRRFEVTNVDVAALKDTGWSVLPSVTLLAGDYNQDGTVNAADYVTWRKGLASGGSYAAWRSNFGASFGAGGNSIVPEPGLLTLLIGAALFGMRSARPRR